MEKHAADKSYLCLTYKESTSTHFTAARWDDMLRIQRIQPCVEQHPHFLSCEGSLREPSGCNRSLRQTLTAISAAQIPLITAGMNPPMGCVCACLSFMTAVQNVSGITGMKTLERQ